MNSNTIAAMLGEQADPTQPGRPQNVVEIGLFLPTNRAAALLQLARERQESVGQVLRKLIDRELAASA